MLLYINILSVVQTYRIEITQFTAKKIQTHLLCFQCTFCVRSTESSRLYIFISFHAYAVLCSFYTLECPYIIMAVIIHITYQSVFLYCRKNVHDWLFTIFYLFLEFKNIVYIHICIENKLIYTQILSSLNTIENALKDNIPNQQQIHCDFIVIKCFVFIVFKWKVLYIIV